MIPQKILQYSPRVQSFIYDLMSRGIPCSQINTNDFSCNTKPSIYITIPYGREGGGKSKRISVNYLNNRSLNSAINFFTTKNKTK